MTATAKEPALSIEDRVAALRLGKKQWSPPENDDVFASTTPPAMPSTPEPPKIRASRFGIRVGEPAAHPVSAYAHDSAAASIAQQEMLAAPGPSPQHLGRAGRFSIPSHSGDVKAHESEADNEYGATNSEDAPEIPANPPPAQDPQEVHMALARAQPIPDPGPWNCETTPAGSAFTPAQWQEAQDANPQCTVFEMLKLEQRALVAVPGMDSFSASLFRRSLVVDLRARHLAPWAEQYASAHLEHSSVHCGTSRYAIIRAASERAGASYLDGSVLRTAEPGAKPVEESRPKTNRFTATASSAPGSGDPAPRSGRFAAAIERMRR